MKRLIVLAVCAIVLSGLTGCQKDFRKEFTKVIDSGEKVPASLAGLWKSDDLGWEIKIEPDGSISTVVPMMWYVPIKVAEGGFYQEGPDKGTYAMFRMGPCKASYNQAGRELNVEIIMDYFQLKLPQGSLEGRSEDYFTGPVSEDGKQWHAKFRSYEYLEGATPPDVDYMDANPELLIFTRVEDGNSITNGKVILDFNDSN